MNISIVILIKNGGATISKTLDSLKAFDDIIIYDTGSTDNTHEIIKRYANVTFLQGDFLGFGITRNKAALNAKNDWVLALDCDEVLDSELVNNLKSIHLDNHTVYTLNFISYYKDIKIKHCGWNNQKISRIYNKNITNFNSNHVHENIDIDKLKTQSIDGNIHHYSYQSISEFIIKIDRYSTLFANDNVGKKYSSPFKAFYNGVYSFFKTYILKKGFLDGYSGLLISFSHMATNFYKYLKLYEMNKSIEK